MATIGELRKAVLGRFFPGCAAFMLSVLTMIAFSSPHNIHFIQLALVTGQLTLMTAGFGAVLFLARSQLPAVPRLGFRSAAAGLLSPLLLLVASGFSQGASLGTMAVLSFTAGVVTGGGLMASAVLRHDVPRKPEDPGVAEALNLLDAELSGRHLAAGASPPAVTTRAPETYERASRSL